MSDVDLEQELANLRRRVDEERFGRFSPRTLAWLALLPEWDDDLARTLGLTGDPAGLISTLLDANLIETRQTLSADGTPRTAFWARRGVRTEIGGYLRASDAIDAAGEFEALFAAYSRHAPADQIAREWLEIAADWPYQAGVAMLVETVDQLVAQGQTADAARTVAVARILGEVLGRPHAETVQRAQWRIDRAHRVEADRKALRHHVRQPRIESALDDLLAPDAERWALHLLGDGGVGKTMTIRYLASGRYAADRNVPEIPVARVDFDHIDPRYPDRRPAELFLAFAGELRGYARHRGDEHAYRSLSDIGTALHEELAAREPDQRRAARLQGDFVAAFADYLRRFDERVVLVLDTCEELAKLYAPGATAPGIDRTFDMLEALHEAHPGVRAIFAGRRWLVPPPRPTATPRLRERPYLRVLRTSGFTADEARAYLVKREAAMLPTGLYGAILERVRRDGDDGSGYNPFELAGYLDWALSDPELTAAKLLAAPGDAYVEQRIIGRIAESQVRAALPVAVEFGRFDQALITPALRRSGVDPARAFDGLAAQEWVTTVETFEATGLPRVVEVDEHLRDRIRRVLISSPEWSIADMVALGRDAAAVIETTRTLGELPVATVTAAVRLLPVTEADRLWRSLSGRVVLTGEWAWATQVTDRVAAIEAERLAETEDQTSTILAAIRATQAASRIHNGLTHDLVELWRDADRWADQHPDPELREELRARARCGRVAANDPDLLVSDYDAVATAPVDAALAACDAFVNRQNYTPALMRWRLAEIADEDLGDPATRVCALVTQAVSTLRADDLELAVAAADAAVSLAEALPGDTPRFSWSDWITPRDLRSRARLVRAVVWLHGGSGTYHDLDDWLNQALSEPAAIEHIDVERLVAAISRLLAADDSTDILLLGRLEAVNRYVPGRYATSWLHEQAGPLVVALANGWRPAAPDRAEQLLREYIDQAVAAGDDPDAVERCQEALDRLRSMPSVPSGRSVAYSRSLAPGPQDLARSFSWSSRVPLSRLDLRLIRALDWRRAAMEYAGPRGLRPDDARPPTYGADRRLLHLIGTPVEARDVWYMRVRDAEVYQTPSEPSARVAVGEHLVEAGRAMVGYGMTSLLVVQADPVDGPAERLGALRSGFLAVALGTVSDETPDAALIVPSLPDVVAGQVVETIWRTMSKARRPPRRAAFERLRDQVRAIVPPHVAEDVLLRTYQDQYREQT